MFLYRLKVEELDNLRVATLKDDWTRREENLRNECPIREMSVVADGADGHKELDIYLALDDLIGADQLKRLVAKLQSFLDFDFKPGRPQPQPRVSSELIHI